MFRNNSATTTPGILRLYLVGKHFPSQSVLAVCGIFAGVRIHETFMTTCGCASAVADFSIPKVLLQKWAQHDLHPNKFSPLVQFTQLSTSKFTLLFLSERRSKGKKRRPAFRTPSWILEAC